jgi:hypothetical protein
MILVQQSFRSYLIETLPFFLLVACEDPNLDNLWRVNYGPN